MAGKNKANKAREILQDNYLKNAIDEFLEKEFRHAEYGGSQYQAGVREQKIVFYVGRVGYAIGPRGRTIQKAIKKLKEEFKHYKIGEGKRLDVTPQNPEKQDLNAKMMAMRIASSLERGHNFRRATYGVIRRVMGAGALGCEVMLSGKVTSQRARLETFREGFVAKSGDPAESMVDKGFTTVIGKRGVLGVRVKIMLPDKPLPDRFKIIQEPTARSVMIEGREMPVILSTQADEGEIAAILEFEEDIDIEGIELQENFDDIDSVMRELEDSKPSEKENKPDDDFEADN